MASSARILAARTSIVSAATLASRALGFVRDAATAALLGVGPVADALTAALALPLLARRLLAEGAFNLAFIPALVRAERTDAAAARALTLTLLILLAGLLGALALVAMVFMPGLIRLLAPGFVPDGERADVAILCGRVAVLYLPLAGLAALYGGIANGAQRVLLAALAPLAANVTVLGVIVILLQQQALPSDTAAWAIAAATVAAGLSQGLVMRLAARGCPAVPHPRAGAFAALPWRPAFGVLRAASPALLFAGLSQFRLLIAAALASGAPGAVAALNYAQRLMDLPLGLVGASAGAVLVPLLVRRSAGTAEAAAALLAALAFALPAGVGLAVLAHPIVAVLFQRGAFDAQDAALTAQLLAVLSLSLPAQGLERVLSAMAAARGLVREAERIALGSLALGLGAGAVGVALLGPVGAAAGVAVSAYGSLVALVLVLARRGILVLERRAAAGAAGLASAASVMGLAVARAQELWPSAAGLAGGWAGAARLALLVGLGVAVYGGCALVLKRAIARMSP